MKDYILNMTLNQLRSHHFRRQITRLMQLFPDALSNLLGCNFLASCLFWTLEPIVLSNSSFVFRHVTFLTICDVVAVTSRIKATIRTTFFYLPLVNGSDVEKISGGFTGRQRKDKSNFLHEIFWKSGVSRIRQRK